MRSRGILLMFLEMQSFSVTKKTDFYRKFADWIDLWCASPFFKLTCQTKSALVITLRAQADLIDELIDDGYKLEPLDSKVIPLKGGNIGK